MRKYTVTYEGDGKLGEEVEMELTPEAEAVMVEAGRLAITPSEYKVVGAQMVHDAKPGETFTAALPLGQELALIAGGAIQAVAASKAKAKATESKDTKGGSK